MKNVLQIEQLRGSPDDHFGLMWLGINGASWWYPKERRDESVKMAKARLKYFRKTHPDRIYRLTDFEILDQPKGFG